MHEGAGQERWSRTAAVICVIANANRDPKKRPREYKPADFDPYEIAKRKAKERHESTPESLALLRETMQAWKGKR
jgi:hypothetical protein